MKLVKIGNNVVEVSFLTVQILYSYSTPVAYRGHEGCFKTEVKHSMTTSKHVNQWGAKGFPTRPQSWFDNLKVGE